MKKQDTLNRISRHLELAAVFVAGAILFYRSPEVASELRIVPDSVEYTAAARSIAFEGRYFIRVCDQDFPPRYAPWFSLLLAPMYKLLGPEPGNAIFVVTALAAFGLTQAYRIGRYLGGPLGGLFASLTLAALPDYRAMSAEIMTDVPCASLLLAAAVVYMVVRSNKQQLLCCYAAAGVLIGMAGALRPAAILAAIPFLMAIPQVAPSGCRLPTACILIVPSLLCLACDMMYNVRIFGSPFRTGYHFWCPVPYEASRLLLSPRYLLPNLGVALYALALPVAVASIGALMLRISKAKPRISETSHGSEILPPLRDCLSFVCSGVGLVSLLHLFYFFPASRFHLPLASCLAAAAGGLLGRAGSERMHRMSLPLLGVFVAGACAVRLAAPATIPSRRAAAVEASQIPPNSILISTLDPVYLDLFIPRQKQIRFVPLSRQVEYASKMIAPRPLAKFKWTPGAWHEHRSASLLEAGARDAVPLVAQEHPELIASALAKGGKAFLCVERTARIPPHAYEKLKERFILIPRSDTLFELALQKNTAESDSDALTAMPNE